MAHKHWGILESAWNNKEYWFLGPTPSHYNLLLLGRILGIDVYTGSLGDFNVQQSLGTTALAG